MRTKLVSHYGDETLENYARGDLSGVVVCELEEHLLLCELCQTRLEEAEQFLSLIRGACAEVRREQTHPARKGMAWAWMLGTPRVVLAGVVTAMALAITVPVMRQTPRATLQSSNVDLHTVRGAGDEMAAHAAAGKLVLNADVSELRQMPTYVLQLVSGSGAEVWKGQVVAVNRKLRQEVPVPVRQGRYWVRVYETGGLHLLREYGLEVQ